ncbi:MAG: ABC transporter ATP-binding protein [Nitrososphaerota archaeon]
MILYIKNLVKHFGEVKAVENVNLSLEEGVITSLVGPNGAGKTTLINIISGAILPDKGKIFFYEKDITNLPPYKRAKMGIGRSFQIPALYNNLTVLDNIRIAIISYLGKANKLFNKIDNEINEKTEEILKIFNFQEKKNLLAQDLSHGDRKLLDVAIAFSLNPKLVLLDEPTSGVSTSEKREIMNTIYNVIKEKRVTALIVEHDMNVVFSYSDEIIVMHEGKIIAKGEPSKIKEDKNVEHILLGVE